MTTALVYDPIFLEHLVPKGHPERPQRMEMSIGYIKALNWLEREGLVQLAPRAASIDELATVHDRAYIQEVEAASQEAAAASAGTTTQQIVQVGTDTYVSAKSYEAALKAAGAPLTAIDAMMKGQIKNAYCLVRPPGHHAVAEAAFGFCIFNNVAVAARYAIDHYGLERVLIIDYDVHHGNGTQEMFYDDPRVLYFSVHQGAPFFPSTGHAHERGTGAAEGTTINVPLPAGAGFEIYEPIFRQILAPAADRFHPQLILVSAGYDAHWKEAQSDTGLELPGMRISNAGFAKLNEIILKIADEQCDGRLIMVQEGGYDLDVVASGASTSLNQLLGGEEAVDSYGPAPDITYQINTDVLIGELRRIHHLTGYRMRNRPKPDIEQLRREIKGPTITKTPAEPAQEEITSCQQEQDKA
ncbi:histone deacetylase family protein [Dictyobacter arantiisoli]|uniref:Histone deacetylase n=1 Tax=Dictyobacter arantiisoli TaxID=2014874 RepID=A0A5A5T9J7_9CHLR|nr:histone deacetylase [Dictyobacter arantiisoli]GCF07703.1 histone deacetylase [Dictyobacter arantiisoli]